MDMNTTHEPRPVLDKATKVVHCAKCGEELQRTNKVTMSARGRLPVQRITFVHA